MDDEAGRSGRNRRDEGQSIGESYRTAHELLSASLSAGLLTYGGYWLDRRYGCLPLLTICGGLMGAVSAVLAVRQVVGRLERQSAREKGIRQSRSAMGGEKPGVSVAPSAKKNSDTTEE